MIEGIVEEAEVAAEVEAEVLGEEGEVPVQEMWVIFE